MRTVGERYSAVLAFMRGVIASVEKQPLLYRVKPDGVAEWFSGRELAKTLDGKVARVEARWLRAKSDAERAQIVDEAERLASEALAMLPNDCGCRRDAGLVDIKLPGAVLDEMQTTDAVIKQLDRDIDNSAMTSTFRDAWRAFVDEWKQFYQQRSGWFDRAWYGTYEKTVEYRRRALEWRQKFVSLGGKPSAPEDKPPTTAGDTLNAVLKYAVIGGGLFVGYKVLTNFLGAKRSERDDTRRALNTELARVARQASGRRSRTYSLQLTRGELQALTFLGWRYGSARAFLDGLIPLDESADAALGGEFNRREGPYRFQIRATDVRKVLKATASDGGDYGAIPNLASDAVAWVLGEEREHVA
jgi:hypothetical protein